MASFIQLCQPPFARDEPLASNDSLWLIGKNLRSHSQKCQQKGRATSFILPSKNKQRKRLLSWDIALRRNDELLSFTELEGILLPRNREKKPLKFFYFWIPLLIPLCTNI